MPPFEHCTDWGAPSRLGSLHQQRAALGTFLMLGLLAHKAAEDGAELCLSPLNAKAVALLAVAAGAPHARPHRRHHAADDRQQHHELRKPTKSLIRHHGYLCACRWVDE